MPTVLVVAILVPVGLAAYFLPSYVAWRRGHKNTPAILALNALLGWTLVGWTVALVWSLLADQEAGPIASRLSHVCPFCNVRVRLAPASVGKTASCGSCGGSFAATRPTAEI